MYNSLLHAHSGLRWIVLAILLLGIFRAFTKWKKGESFVGGDKMIYLMGMIFTHIQLLVGLVLYMISPKVLWVPGSMGVPALRFFNIEHLFMMLIAIALITMGYVKSKKATDSKKKHRLVFVWYAIALVIMMISIPWPFRAHLGGGWF